jgi:vancomycin permeability regulator SanA
LVTETWRECESLEMPQLNAAIILGSEFTEQGGLSEDLKTRLDKALDLFHAGKRSRRDENLPRRARHSRRSSDY